MCAAIGCRAPYKNHLEGIFFASFFIPPLTEIYLKENSIQEEKIIVSKIIYLVNVQSFGHTKLGPKIKLNKL